MYTLLREVFRPTGATIPFGRTADSTRFSSFRFDLLRTMNLIYESVKEKGGLVIAPSAFGEAFNNIDSFLK